MIPLAFGCAITSEYEHVQKVAIWTPDKDLRTACEDRGRGADDRRPSQNDSDGLRDTQKFRRRSATPIRLLALVVYGGRCFPYPWYRARTAASTFEPLRSDRKLRSGKHPCRTARVALPLQESRALRTDRHSLRSSRRLRCAATPASQRWRSG